MERGAHLRAVFNRKVTMTGDFAMDDNRTCILLKGFSAQDLEGKSRKILKEGDVIELIADATVQVKDRVLTLRAHPDLYRLGNVRMLPMITPADGVVQLGISFQAAARIDLKKLEYLAEVYING